MISTPFDDDLAKLSAELEDTRFYFGNKEEKAKQRRRLEAGDKLRMASSPAVLARRAKFNSSASGKRNFLGDGELIAELEADSIELEAIPAADLPEEIQGLDENQKRDFVKKASEKRKNLLGRMRALSESRSDYIATQVKDVDDLDESLDNQIYDAVKEQAAKKGLVYEEGPSY